jgi:phosphoribosyl 1,2-cyclic phosphodiesterase
LRGDSSLRGLKIVVTSGRDFASDKQAAITAGADEYLTKPVSGERLAEVLSKLVAGLQPEPQRSPAHPPTTVTRLKFWGVRGSIPTPGPTTVFYGGNTSCVEVRAAGEIIILDAGTGLRLLGRELNTEFEDQPLDLTLLLTHTHWDHIQGLPFFLPVYNPRNHLRILGYEGARHGLDRVLTSQMESPFFPIGLREVPANVRIEELKEMSFRIGTIEVRAFFANHPGICVGYRLFTPAGSIAFFPDNEPFFTRNGTGRRQPSKDDAAQKFARERNAEMIDFLKGTDLLIMDTQYDREEYEAHVGWGHGCLDDVVALAMEADVRQLSLFHHDPNHDDAKIEEMVARGREKVAESQHALKVEAAREGQTIEFGP